MSHVEIRAAVSLPQGGACLQTVDGSLHLYRDGRMQQPPGPAEAAEFPEFCPIMRAVPAEASEGRLQSFVLMKRCMISEGYVIGCSIFNLCF